MGISEFARRSRLSAKALRLYDAQALLSPARVDEVNGYRYYDTGQIGRARLIGALRQLEMPLATIRELLDSGPERLAAEVAAFWREAERRHAARRDLAEFLVQEILGKGPPMYEVATRHLPARSLLCLKRNVDEPGAWALGKEFLAILRRDQRLARLAGPEGAAFCVYWGMVGADSDGPLEWCRPVPDDRVDELAARFPELTLRTEPEHDEAFVALPPDMDADPARWQLVHDALMAWAGEHGIRPESLTLTPDDLGVRITYTASGPEASAPDREFAVPFAA
jgi:DNA-binding transcriptional MerR regulator